MRRAVRIAGTLLILAGALTLAWTLLVWQWQDPFTALYTKWKQHQLASQYQKRRRGVLGPDRDHRRLPTSAGALRAKRSAIARTRPAVKRSGASAFPAWA